MMATIRSGRVPRIDRVRGTGMDISRVDNPYAPGRAIRRNPLLAGRRGERCDVDEDERSNLPRSAAPFKRRNNDPG